MVLLLKMQASKTLQIISLHSIVHSECVKVVVAELVEKELV